MREIVMDDPYFVFYFLLMIGNDWSCCCSFFFFDLAAYTAAPAECHLSSKADAALVTDLRGVYVGDREQQRHIVLGQLQRRCDVRQPTGIGFQQKCGQRF